MGWEGGHWVLTETERERGREIRGGGGTGLHGNTIRQTGDARRQRSRQGRQVDR